MAFLPYSLLLVMCSFQILSGIHLTSVLGQCVSDERLKLLQFKGSLNFDSANSAKLVHWNHSRDCCTWQGLSCDDFGHVISLELINEMISLRTEDWKSLFALQHLEKLNLAFNNFNSSIPSELCNLGRLKQLNLSYAGFIGQIPICLSRMKSVITLDLSSRLPGIEPLEAKNPGLKAVFGNLTELRELYLDGVNISAQGRDWCDALSSLSKLQVLSLIGCHLSGPIHSSLLKLRSLTVIQLSGNYLSITVPDFFANYTNLTALSLSTCNLQGYFPQKIFQVRSLQRLDLSDNQVLVGRLPEFSHGASLTEIILRYTSFSGTLPISIGNIQQLSRIDLTNCNFSGPIPATVINLTELVYLDFSFNNFNGSIPTFQMSKRLAHIDLSHNVLSGTISSAHFEGLVNLVHINLGYNTLTGGISPSLFALPSLQKLQLSNNKFNGELHEFPNVSTSLLHELDLSSNCLNGSIPKFILKLNWIDVLSLSSNFFSGTIKLEFFESLQNLTKLELSDNNLSIDASRYNSSPFSFPQLSVLKLSSCNLNTFPDLKNQTDLITLDLSENHIKGKIPNWIWQIGLQEINLSFNFLEDLQKPYSISSYLLVLDLHANQLWGDIPSPPDYAVYIDYSSNKFNTSISSNFGDHFSWLTFLSLSNNSIVGVIPESTCKASYLRVLDFSNNSLSGILPACLLEMPELGVLNLGGNKLHGTISDLFKDNCTLSTLDLSRNALEGKFPRSLGNCKPLQLVNMGHNHLEDTFPCPLMRASDLHVFILRSNKFHGELHCSSTNNSWKSLQIMDIAYNNFTGVLPQEFFLNLKGMQDDSPPATRDHLQYHPFRLTNLYYIDTVPLMIKGIERQVLKILKIFKTIDFSCNNFHGRIPEAVGQLEAIYFLNLSHNSLTGEIPESMGNLTQLESLDLSMNQLRGRIPVNLGGLTFLSFLNLSFNHLFGTIPNGRQLQTFSESSFLGNTGLCGFPLNISCNESEANGFSPQSPFERQSAKNEIEWEYISAALGFSVGLGIISWLNFSNPRWWQKFNAFVFQLLLRILQQRVKHRTFRNPVRRL